MKRLFYVIDNLDEAESISDEVHSLGIQDDQFYVVARDAEGIEAHHLHGSQRLEDTEIIAAQKRSNWLAIIAAVVAGAGLSFLFNTTVVGILSFIALCGAIFLIFKFITSTACNSFDQYFKNLLNEHLDNGDAILVIDTKGDQTNKVQTQLQQHPKASFIADSTNIHSPIPH